MVDHHQETNAPCCACRLYYFTLTRAIDTVGVSSFPFLSAHILLQNLRKTPGKLPPMPIVPSSLYVCHIYNALKLTPTTANLKNRVEERGGEERKERRSPSHTGSPSHPAVSLGGRKNKIKNQSDSKKSMYHKLGHSINRVSLVSVTKYSCGRMVSLRMPTRLRNLS